MPISIRRLYIKFINAEIAKENESRKGRSTDQPSNTEVLNRMKEFTQQDPDNKSGLNLEKNLNKTKREKYYEQ